MTDHCVPRKVALLVAYAGSGFHGFQFQNPSLPTVQRDLEQALGRVANHPVALVCAGRTDTGVHATHQVVHFETLATRPAEAWCRGTNRYLPDTVSVLWAGEVDTAFSARFSATARRYLYLIHTSAVRSPFLVNELTYHSKPLDAAAMEEAAQQLLGEHDFTSFRAAGCQARTPFREIREIGVRQCGDIIAVDVTASAFLHHMVRNIVGALLLVGEGRREPGWIGEVLAARDRRLAGATASPKGLYLIDVTYPADFGIPAGPSLPHLFSTLVT
ncbi:MAG: tRNA pseudouridine(38-40) synthase TruA [Pseudomonadota bacterium]